MAQRQGGGGIFWDFWDIRFLLWRVSKTSKKSIIYIKHCWRWCNLSQRFWMDSEDLVGMFESLQRKDLRTGLEDHQFDLKGPERQKWDERRISHFPILKDLWRVHFLACSSRLREQHLKSSTPERRGFGLEVQFQGLRLMRMKGFPLDAIRLTQCFDNFHDSLVVWDDYINRINNSRNLERFGMCYWVSLQNELSEQAWSESSF